MQKYRPAVPQNPEEHSRLVDVLEDLELSGRILDLEEAQFADLVSALVLHYENLVCPMREVPALEMLQHLVETRGLRHSDRNSGRIENQATQVAGGGDLCPTGNASQEGQ